LSLRVDAPDVYVWRAIKSAAWVRSGTGIPSQGTAASGDQHHWADHGQSEPFHRSSFLTPAPHTHLEPCASGVVNLQIAIPSQFPPPEIPLGNVLEPGPLQVVRLDAPLGGCRLWQ